jgi:DNA replication protein DnaC
MTTAQAATVLSPENPISSRLRLYLKELHLPTVREVYDEAARMAEREHMSFEQYLLHVIERECEVRRTNRIGRLLRDSGLPLEKTFTTFNRDRLPRAQNAQVTSLLDGSFLERTENVLVFGRSGSGKTHLLSAIAHELIHTHEKRIRFTTCSILVQELLLAKRDLKLARYLKRMARYDGLVIDEVGYIQQSRDEMEVLFTLLADRYERGSILLTSNLPFSKWDQIFKDPTTTAAAVDRLVHHSIIIELNLDSYRLEASKKLPKQDPRGSARDRKNQALGSKTQQKPQLIPQLRGATDRQK